MPDVDDNDVEALSKAIQQLVIDRRIKASTQAVLVGMLSAVSQGSCAQGLPKPQAWVEPESEEEPEEEPEEEEPMVVASGDGVSEQEYDERVVSGVCEASRLAQRAAGSVVDQRGAVHALQGAVQEERGERCDESRDGDERVPDESSARGVGEPSVGAGVCGEG